MAATKILWGQILAVFLLVLSGIWGATQWTASALGYQPELGQPWFAMLGWPVYRPYDFFWWWFSYDAYAPHIFERGGYIAASGGFTSMIVAIGMSVWRAREMKTAATYGTARWAMAGGELPGDQFRAACVASRQSRRRSSGSLRTYVGPSSMIFLPSVSTTARSTASSEVPLIRPRNRICLLNSVQNGNFRPG